MCHMDLCHPRSYQHTYETYDNSPIPGTFALCNATDAVITFKMDFDVESEQALASYKVLCFVWFCSLCLDPSQTFCPISNDVWMGAQ